MRFLANAVLCVAALLLAFQLCVLAIFVGGEIADLVRIALGRAPRRPRVRIAR